jgi:hypothetical protein
MSVNGQNGTASAAHVLRWPGRVLTGDDLRKNLNGHREIVLSPRAVVTPVAADELRTHGVRIVRERPTAEAKAGPMWGYAQEWTSPLVESAVRTLDRDGLVLRELQAGNSDEPCRWARAVAECVARGECQGGVVFCRDPGLVCCVANKLAGLRSVAVLTIAQAARATLTLAPNLVAVEMPGRTFFEIRQILRTLATCDGSNCPGGVATTLKELDGHAHR